MNAADIPTHAVFDGGSRYNLLRKGLSPPVKMHGYFRWLAHRGRNKTTTLLPPRQDAALAAEASFAMAAAKHDAPYLILLGESPDQPLQGSVFVQILPPREGPRTIYVRVELLFSERLVGRLPARFRAFVLEPEVRAQLIKAVDRDARDSPENLAAVFRNENVVRNRDIARVLSAVPEVEGTIGPDRYGKSEPEELPDTQPEIDKLPPGVTVVVLVGPCL